MHDGTPVITIRPPLQIVDIGNGCEAYSASIYIPAKSELMATLQSVTRSQFFLEYNFNYTNVNNFLIRYKSDLTKLANKEIKTLKAKVLKLPTMSMEIFDNILENIDEDPKTLLYSLKSWGFKRTIISIMGPNELCFKGKLDIMYVYIIL